MKGLRLKFRLFFMSKFFWFGLGLLGVTHRWSGVLMALGATGVAVLILRDGLRSQFWIKPEAQYARIWEDLVWSHSTWINRGETPEQGVERLAGPWQKRAAQPVAVGPAPCRYCPRGAVSCSGHGVQHHRRD